MDNLDISIKSEILIKEEPLELGEENNELQLAPEKVYIFIY